MIYAFGECELDVARREVRRRGDLIAIQPKMFEVLLYLLEHRDRVVRKEELFAQCWPDTFVTEAALTRCLTKLRKTVQGERDDTSIIKTVHRQGYRFVAPVETLPVAPRPLSMLTTPPPAPPSVPSAPKGDPPPAAAPAAPPVATVPLLAERRQLTVLCCEFVGVAQLAVQLDPEDLHALLRIVHATCADIIAQLDGYIAQQLDAGLVVYFGYPHAHEDAVQRAVRTGLRLIETLREQPLAVASSPASPLALRIGIHTGPVVVEPSRIGGLSMPIAVGATATIAAGLRDRAAPQTVVISERTAQLVEGYFVWQPLGTYTVPGYTSPIAMYQVSGESNRQTRLDVAAVRGLTPFVGRAVELALLQERWQQAQEGMGQVVILSGEAGIGKSRLVRALCEAIADASPLRLECRCSPYYQHTALYPVLELLRQALHADHAVSEAERLKALERLVQQCHLDVRESVMLLAPLLALTPPGERYPLLALAPQHQRQRTLEILLDMLLALAAQQPVLFIVEDVHWVDPSTLEWLGLLVDQGPTASVMTLMTCRPGFHHPWGNRAHVTSITVHRLLHQQVAQMVQAITGETPVPSALIEHIVACTDGVPLFVEEVTKLVLAAHDLSESGRQTTADGLR